MSFWIDDIDDMLRDFGVTVTLVNYLSSDSATAANADITAIFDDAQRVIDLQDGQVVSAKAQITAKSADVENVLRRSVVQVAGVSYYVNDILDGGTGITVLIVSEK